MKSYDTIRYEVAEAAAYVRETAGSGNMPVANTAADITDGLDFYGSLAELDDDAPIQEELDTRVERNEVAVRTVSELALVYQAIGDVHGLWIPGSVVNYGINHESLHAKAAPLAGYNYARMGVVITRSVLPSRWNPLRTRRVELRPFHIIGEPTGVTKLGIASVIAAPDMLSDGDKLKLEAMGYNSPDDVARRIVERDSSLHVPASYGLQRRQR